MLDSLLGLQCVKAYDNFLSACKVIKRDQVNNRTIKNTTNNATNQAIYNIETFHFPIKR